MNAFRLDGYDWTVPSHCLTVRRAWWAYAMGCLLAFSVLIAPALIVRSVKADPSIWVGGTRHSRGTEIRWEQQTTRQRTEHLVLVCIPVFVLTLLPLTYILIASHVRRNPLVFDKSTNQIRKGARALAALSAAHSIAVVDILRAPALFPALQGAPQIFIRFNAEPWSVRFHCYSRKATAKRAAEVLSAFLAVPVVHDPIVMRRPEPAGRGFPVITKRH